MLSTKDIYRLQSEYSVAEGNIKDVETSYDEYLANCRVFLTSNLPADYNNGKYDSIQKTNKLIELASQFIDNHPVKVKGYVSPEGVIDRDLLQEDLTDSITGVSILKEALEEDPDVDEIQINDKGTIFVAKKGVLVPYVDSKGRVMQFTSDDEIKILLNKLIDDGTGNIPQFTDGMPILNAKTAKHQYRINAVHSSLNTMDKPPYNFPISTVVIRKFKEVKLCLDDLVASGACTEQMARLLDKLGRAELKLFCVGPTGSGKTTLLDIIAKTIPLDKRIILVQNPTEIFLTERDELGRNIRNVVHWEVKDTGGSSKDDQTKGTMENLISNTLRATPDVILVGESRTPGEFAQINRAMRTGHKVLGTFHAEDSADALGRYATELGTATGSTYEESLRLACETIDIIISQYKFPNGERKIMEIAEIQGYKDGKPLINKLFEFKFSGNMIKDENGRDKVDGRHEQVGVLSENLRKTFYKACIGDDQIGEFCTMGDKETE